ncbi:class I SAM-dependent methyltransferase [uncultured Chloroflexus sp.]|uniref:class I SAM-dependent methyltransferase n=1 Tax=uncultured Chloroflexus sp. TaxID=214040 RepID=UPI00260713BA|nr:class I SAM-dependent methyltransferase [uncultured Chloroflexus sp.]
MAAVELQHWWYGGMRAINAAMLDRVFGGRRDLRILDAGCGTGGDALFLRRYGTVVGLDLATAALALARGRIPGWLARGSVLQLPFADHSFDLVTSFDVLYHRAVIDERQALAEMRRVLRRDGRLLIRLPAYEWLRSRHDRQVHTRHRYTAGEVARLLRENGFTVEQLTYALTLLFPISAAVRLLERVLPEPQTASAMELPSRPVNAALRLPMMLEAAYIGRGGKWPFGLSIVALARV